jgi:hypothetical protein
MWPTTKEIIMSEADNDNEINIYDPYTPEEKERRKELGHKEIKIGEFTFMCIPRNTDVPRDEYGNAPGVGRTINEYYWDPLIEWISVEGRDADDWYRNPDSGFTVLGWYIMDMGYKIEAGPFNHPGEAVEYSRKKFVDHRYPVPQLEGNIT